MNQALAVPVDSHLAHYAFIVEVHHGIRGALESVLVDVGLPHLDRPFEYLVPVSMADLAVPGARVRVRFAGQDVDGFVLERRATAVHEGKLAPLRRVVSPEVVLTPRLLTLCQEVAARYAGTLGDVLRRRCIA